MTALTLASSTPNGELGFLTTPAESLFILAVLVIPLAVIIGAVAWLVSRRRAPRETLVDMPRHTRTIAARTLDVHTANISPDSDDIIVVITLDADAFSQLLLIDDSLTLTTPNSRPVTFSTETAGGAPTLDPNLGWIIPVSDATRAELHALPAGPGEHELTTTHVAFIVE